MQRANRGRGSMRRRIEATSITTPPMAYKSPDEHLTIAPRTLASFGYADAAEAARHRFSSDPLENWLAICSLSEEEGRAFVAALGALEGGRSMIHAIVFNGLTNSAAEDWEHCHYLLDAIDHVRDLPQVFEEADLSEISRSLGTTLILGRVDLSREIWAFANSRQIAEWKLIGRVLHEQLPSALPQLVTGLKALGKSDANLARGIRDASTWRYCAAFLDEAVRLPDLALVREVQAVVAAEIQRQVENHEGSEPRPDSDRPVDHLQRVDSRITARLATALVPAEVLSAP